MSERVEHSEAATPLPPEVEEGTQQPCPPPAQLAKRSRRKRMLLGLLVLLPLVVVLGGFGVDRLLHRGQVLRGVTLSGRSLAGLDGPAVDEAVVELERRLNGSNLVVRVRRFEVQLEPAQLAFELDRQATRNLVLSAGRRGGWHVQLWWWLARFRSAESLQAVGVLDKTKLDALIDNWQPNAIDDLPFEGAIVVEEGKPRAQPPRRGWVIDRAGATVALLQGLVRESRQAVVVPLIERAPV